MIDTKNIVRVKNYKGHQDWSMKAKKNGYPLCRQCKEPVEIHWWGRWKKNGNLCEYCEREERIILRT